MKKQAERLHHLYLPHLESSLLFRDLFCVLKVAKIDSPENVASEWYTHHVLSEKEKLTKNWKNDEKLVSLDMKDYDPQKKKCFE